MHDVEREVDPSTSESSRDLPPEGVTIWPPLRVGQITNAFDVETHYKGPTLGARGTIGIN